MSARAHRMRLSDDSESAGIMMENMGALSTS